VLPAETEKVWNFLKAQPALAGFILGGGSALALTIRHRLSEDLDFIFPEIRLPQPRLAVLQHQAAANGFVFTRNDDEAALQEFASSGMELHDYQQDFVVNGKVKVSFFAPDEPLRKIFPAGGEKTRVATLKECFQAKCLVSAVRSKTRDWLDLFLLMRDHGFSIRDYRAAFAAAGIPAQCDAGLTRLCSGVPGRDDEGYQHLLAKPPSLAEMKAFFILQRDELEIETAADARQKNQL
jgi:hypothetical protein